MKFVDVTENMLAFSMVKFKNTVLKAVIRTKWYLRTVAGRENSESVG